MRDWDVAVLVATALVTLIAIVGLIEVMRRARGQARLRETLARVLHDLESPSGSGAQDADSGSAAENETGNGSEPRR